jgi:hypothetical protein
MPDGRAANQLLYRDDEPRLEIVETGRPWVFDEIGNVHARWSIAGFSGLMASLLRAFDARAPSCCMEATA